MCDTMVRVTDDGVLFAKNSDRDPNECQTIEWHRGVSHSDAETLDCTWRAVDQVERTNTVLLSRPWWMWGAEIGANQHGVVIGNEAVFTDQPLDDDGLLGMDLLRLALERAATAADAVQVIVTLLERHGQGGSCSRAKPSFTYHNSYLVADPTTAFVLETAGRRWATEEVAAGTARSISNGLTIPAFAAAHADRARGFVAACATRRARTEAAASTATTPHDLMTALRSHGASATPTYSPIHGGLRGPCVHGGGLVTSSQTTSSWVSDLRPGSTGHWVTATAAPCTSIFKPVQVDNPVDLGPGGTDRYDESVRWWRHERLHRTVDRAPAALLARFTSERDALERAWLAEPPTTATAFEVADAAEERWFADVSTSGVIGDRRPQYVRREWARLDREARMPERSGR